MARKIDNIILHCSDSPFGCAREIRKWHMDKGWRDIGYHFVVNNGYPIAGFYIEPFDGSIECGRYLDEDKFIEENEVGAHALGYNAFSIGVCMIGKTSFSQKQLHATVKLITRLMAIYDVKAVNVIGHYETEKGKAQGKTCPNINMVKFREYLSGHSGVVRKNHPEPEKESGQVGLAGNIGKVGFKLVGGGLVKKIWSIINGRKTKGGVVVTVVSVLCRVLLWSIKLAFPEVGTQIPENTDQVLEALQNTGIGVAGVGVGHKMVKADKRTEVIEEILTKGPAISPTVIKKKI